MMELQYQFGTNAFAGWPKAFLAGRAGGGKKTLVAADYKEFRALKSRLFSRAAAPVLAAQLHWRRACTLVGTELVKKPHGNSIPVEKKISIAVQEISE